LSDKQNERLKIEPRLPNDYGDGEATRFIEGAEIIRFGSAADGRVLAIEFAKDGNRELLTIRFSELGLWIESHRRLEGHLANRGGSE
jgi:hypothetical protein